MPTATATEIGERIRQLEANCTGLLAPNGATILQARLLSVRDEVHEFVVLCVWHQEFVTWRMYIDADTGESECYWGHYHATGLDAAIEDYKER